MKRNRQLALILAIVMCIALAALLLAGCKEDETPITNNGSSTTLETDKLPEELSADNVIYAFLDRQSKLGSYKLSSVGTAVASLAGYEQDINNTTYKNGDDYLNEASSNSVLVKMSHQAFSKNGKVVYRDGTEGELSVATKEDYKKVYGLTADDVTLGGYIVNAKTLRYARLDKTEGDNLTYYMLLAGDQSFAAGTATESATTGISLQSKAYGSLDEVPAYSDVEIWLTIKKDWTPVSFTSKCHYDAVKVFNMSVEQQVTATYSEVNGQVVIPSVSDFNAKIGSTPSKVEVVAQENPFVLDLAETFAQLDYKNGVAVDVEITTPGMGLSNSLGVLPAYWVCPVHGGTLAVPKCPGDDGACNQTLTFHTTPITATLLLRYNESALQSKNYLGAIEAYIDVDLSNLKALLDTLGMFASMGLPEWLGATDSLQVAYLGDGTLSVAVLNANGDAVFAAQVNLVEKLLPLLQGGLANVDTDTLLPTINAMFTEVEAESGKKVSLNSEYVAVINSAYQGLMENLHQTIIEGTGGDPDNFMASMGWYIVNNAIGADIHGLEISLDQQDGTTNLAVEVIGLSQFYTVEEDNMTDANRQNPFTNNTNATLLRVALNIGSMTKEQGALLAGAVDEAKSNLDNAAIAKQYEERIAQLEQEFDLADEKYAEKVASLKGEVDELAADVKPYIASSITLLNKLSTDWTSQKTAADAFVEALPTDNSYSDKDEKWWTALNTAYEAVKDKPAIYAYVGVVSVRKVEGELSKHRVETVNTRIAAGKSTYANATTQTELQAMLDDFYGNIESAYTALTAEEKQQVQTAYDQYFVAVHTKNLQALKAAWTDIQPELTAAVEELTKEQTFNWDKFTAIIEKVANIYYWQVGGTNAFDDVKHSWTDLTRITVPAGNEELATLVSEVKTLYGKVIFASKENTFLAPIKDKMVSTFADLYKNELAKFVTKQYNLPQSDVSSFKDKAAAESLLKKLKSAYFVVNTMFADLKKVDELKVVDAENNFAFHSVASNFITKLKAQIKTLEAAASPAE